MVDSEITRFFEYRKDLWLKKNLKASMSEIEVREKITECEAVFALKEWLPNASKRAGQISICTHPCTFSHPSSRKNKNDYTSSIIANSTQAADGFIRSGNVNVAADALGNAAALDVYKFLTLVMQDGQSLLQHIEQETTLAIDLLSLSNRDDTESYQRLRKGFLEMASTKSEIVTSSKIKQVFFPVGQEMSNENEYHQLSILTASGIVFDLRKRLDAMRFGDKIKLAREKRKKNENHEGYSEIYNLTTIGYGGTKPQNISVLNNQNGGKAHLLMSAPPELKNRTIHFPKTDFFEKTINCFQCKYQFYQLHKLYGNDSNNRHIRAARDEYYASIINHIIEKMWQVRSVSPEQFNAKESRLTSAQATWLSHHEELKAVRESSDEWLNEIIEKISKFIFNGYEKVLGKKTIKLSDEELKHMKNIVINNKEALR